MKRFVTFLHRHYISGVLQATGLPLNSIAAKYGLGTNGSASAKKRICDSRQTVWVPPKHADPWGSEKARSPCPSHRKLRATFLEFVIRRMSWRSEDRRPRLIISCAVITGDVDLAWHDIAPALIFSRSRLEGQVDLQGTRLQRTLAILNSTVTGPFTASGLTSKDGLYLRDDSRFADVILRGARVDGDIVLNGSTVSGKLDANRLSVGGSLALRNGGTFADVGLKGAKILGTAAFDESQILGTFNADGLQVGQGFTFRSWWQILRNPLARSTNWLKCEL